MCWGLAQPFTMNLSFVVPHPFDFAQVQALVAVCATGWGLLK